MQENTSEQSLRELGKVLVSQEKWKEALSVYSSILQIHKLTSKQQAIAYSNRSLCYLKLKKLDESYDDAVKSSDKAPEWFKGYLRFAYVLLEKGQWQSACMAMENGIGKEEDNGTMEKLIKSIRMKSYPSLINNIDQKEIHLKFPFLDSKKVKNEEICNIELKDVALIWIKEVFSRYHLRKEIMPIELLERRQLSNFELPEEVLKLVGKQSALTSEIWLAKKILQKDNNPETFSRNDSKETNFNMYWKYRTGNMCSYLNGGLLLLVEKLISKKIFPYVLNLNDPVSMKEKQYINSGYRLSCYFSKPYKNPWIFCQSENHFEPLVKGSGMIDSKTCKQIGSARTFNHHLVALFPFISRSKEEPIRKAQIVDLTSPQFDVFSYEQGFPYASYRVEDLRNPDVEGLLLGRAIIGIDEENFMIDLKEMGYNIFDLWKDAQDASFKRILEIVKEEK